MATSINGIKRTNLFIKSSVDDYQDPVFLTFRVDFFPPTEQYPKFDGLMNSSLLRDPRASSDNPNQIVEYSTEDWLGDYYPNNADGVNDDIHPKKALQNFKKKLHEVQSSPWYFQSIMGIGDLWKAMHKIKEGNQKTTLTFNCIDSIRQPLTDIAENYRYAIYDQERLSYRVPDNLRWFDMVIDLVEIRDIADKSGQFFQTDASGEVTEGLKLIQFRCKMCEFDFSNFFGGSQSDHKIATEEKPFSPSFTVDVGWVIQEKVSLSDATNYRRIGMFSGAMDDLNSKLTRFLQTATRLPGAIVGSVLEEIQTTVETAVIGNAYTGFNNFLSEMNMISGNITGRNPVVGPPIVSNVGEDVYPGGVKDNPVNVIGNAYSAANPTAKVTDIGDVYPDQPAPIPTSELGDVYP